MRSWIGIGLLVLVGVGFALAQDAPQGGVPQTAPLEKQEAHRPTIGLVLEGGGALGLAHVGVVRWLEEHHIPVDYVAGTSMGGLVGGLYATGRSANEMAEVVKEIDWNKALGNETPYRARSFRRKEDERDLPNKFEFGLKNGVSLPSGFNSGHQVGLILDRIALPYSDLNSFDELPTPFRCVATDLVSEKAIVFDRGSLAEALRATMSLPGVFSPVRRDDQVLVDGGLLKNLPVDVARAMGADIVIAVHLEVKPLNPKEPLSAFGVLGESVSVVIAANELASMQKADVLIPVHTQEYTSLDYAAADRLIQLGYDGAQERAKVLERFTVSDEEWNAHVAFRKERTRPVPVPQFVEVTGPAAVISEGIAKSLSVNVGQPVDPKLLNRELTEITGLGRFSRAGYQLVKRGDTEGLLIRADEKDYAPPLLKPIFIIDGADYNNVRFSLGARITLLDLGGFGSELRTDIIGGAQYGLQSEYYHPLSWKSHLFVAPRGFATSTPFDLYLDNNRIAEYRERNVGGGLDFGIAISRFSELRFGYQIGQFSFHRDIGTPELPSGSGRQSFSRIQFVSDYRDNPVVPRQGYYLKYGFRFYDANLDAARNFPWTELQTQFFQRVSRSGSVFLGASGGTTFGFNDVDTGFPAFSLGGPTQLAAYGRNELLTNQFFLFQPGYLHQLKQLSPLLGGSISLFGMYEVAKAYSPVNITGEPGLPQDFNGGLLIQTPFGPVIFGGAVGNKDHHRVYFQLGKFF
jgi:NTE family protein